MALAAKDIQTGSVRAQLDTSMHYDLRICALNSSIVEKSIRSRDSTITMLQERIEKLNQEKVLIGVQIWIVGLQ